MKDETIRHKIIHKNQEWFSICDSVSGLIAKIVNSFDVPKHKIDLIFLTSLFGKIVNSYDSAIILIQNGYIQDSGTIIRSLMESIFVLKACIDDDKYLNDYYRTDIADLNIFLKNQARYIDDMKRKYPDVDECLCNSLKEANSQIEAYGEVSCVKYNALIAANIAGLQNIYYSTYSLLSCINAHPSPRAVFSRIEFDHAGYPSELKIGPETDSADRMLLLLVQLMIVALECMDKKLETGLSSDIARVFALFREREKNICG